MDIGIKINSFLDISLIAVLLYVIFIWFKKTRAAFVLIGIGILALLYALALQFDLRLTTQIFQSFLTVVLIGVIIIFQQEIRYFFEQVAIWSLNRKFKGRRAVTLPDRDVSILSKTLFDLAEERIGALLVIQRRDVLTGHIDGGVLLEGRLSEHILKSIFDPHSMGHDGAVVINGDKITHLGAHLPLSKDSDQLGYRGTRHAAALGLSERTDALCLVVSEERGTISYAFNSKLKKINTASELNSVLESFYAELRPKTKKMKLVDYLKKNSKEKIVAFGVATVLWFVQVYGAELTYKKYEVPIEFRDLADDLKVAEIESPEIRINFTGPRRSFYGLKSNAIRLAVDASDFKPGPNYIRLSESDVSFPNGLILRSMSPRTQSVHFAAKE